jgi:hypothetical protein
MSIPLVQNNEKDSINTSIIAIKRNIERINMLLGLVDSGSPDLSGLATKQELEDAITQVETDLAPVDEVTSGNMQSVTSNAVAESCPRYINYDKGNIWTTSKTSFTTTKDCYLDYNVCAITPADRNIYIDNKKVGVQDSDNGIYIYSFHGFVKRGSIIRRGDNISLIGGTYLNLFELI